MKIISIKEQQFKLIAEGQFDLVFHGSNSDETFEGYFYNLTAEQFGLIFSDK